MIDPDIRIKTLGLSKNFARADGQKRTDLSELIAFLKNGKKDRVEVITEVSLEARRGEIIGITGKNGSGKTTLLSTIGGIYQPSSGSLYTNGHIISAIGFISGLKDRLTVEENIYLCCALYGLTPKEVRKNLSGILEVAEL